MNPHSKVIEGSPGRESASHIRFSLPERERGMNLCLDLDGTLITCEPRQSEVLRAAAKAVGYPVEPASIWALKREGASTAEALRATGVPEPIAARMMVHWLAWIEEPGWLSLDSPFAGVDDC